MSILTEFVGTQTESVNIDLVLLAHKQKVSILTEFVGTQTESVNIDLVLLAHKQKVSILTEFCWHTNRK